jgi:hypothetical protein
MALAPNESAQLATLTNTVSSLAATVDELLSLMRVAGQGGSVDIAVHEGDADAHSLLGTDEPDAGTLMRRNADGQAQVEAPTSAKDIVNKEYADALVGGTSAPTPDTAMRRDASGRSQAEAPSAQKDIVNKAYADALGVVSSTANTIMRRSAGGTSQVETPSAPKDIANKGYVDDAVSAAGSGSSSADLTAHNSDASAHSNLGTVAATGGTIMRRDSTGRVQAYLPSSSSDVATKGYVDTAVANAGGSGSGSGGNIDLSTATGTLGVTHGGTGLTSAPSMLTNLASTSAASPFAASPRPGVTGTLPIGSGGTGATAVAAALSNLGGMPTLKASSGVGQMVPLGNTSGYNNPHVTIPSGGTWIYFLWTTDSFTDITVAYAAVNVVAGGTTVNCEFYNLCFAVRIA